MLGNAVVLGCKPPAPGHGQTGLCRTGDKQECITKHNYSMHRQSCHSQTCTKSCRPEVVIECMFVIGPLLSQWNMAFAGNSSSHTA
jgi:hypothetical protein